MPRNSIKASLACAAPSITRLSVYRSQEQSCCGTFGLHLEKTEVRAMGDAVERQVGRSARKLRAQNQPILVHGVQLLQFAMVQGGQCRGENFNRHRNVPGFMSRRINRMATRHRHHRGEPRNRKCPPCRVTRPPET